MAIEIISISEIKKVKRRRRSKTNTLTMEDIERNSNGRFYKPNPNCRSEYANYVRKQEEKQKLIDKYSIQEDELQ